MEFQQASVFSLEYLHAFACSPYRCYSGLQSSGVMGSVVDSLGSFRKRRCCKHASVWCLDGTQVARREGEGEGQVLILLNARSLETERRTSFSAPRGCSLPSAVHDWMAAYARMQRRYVWGLGATNLAIISGNYSTFLCSLDGSSLAFARSWDIWDPGCGRSWQLAGRSGFGHKTGIRRLYLTQKRSRGLLRHAPRSHQCPAAPAAPAFGRGT